MKASDIFMQGYSCSEAIVKWAIEEDLCSEAILPSATAFSGGIGSGCLCGAISGAQLVIGHLYGRNNPYGNEIIAKQLAKEFINKFKEEYPATCCKVLSKGFEPNTIERKQHCKQFVDFCVKILNETIREKV